MPFWGVCQQCQIRVKITFLLVEHHVIREKGRIGKDRVVNFLRTDVPSSHYRHRMFDHGASDDLLSFLPLVSPIVSLRVLIRSCCLSLRKKQGIPIMTEHQLSLLPFYAGWGIYNQRLVAAIAPLTAEQLALRNSPQNWSIGMYAKP